MTTLNKELYEALIEAGASEEKAKKAAVDSASIMDKLKKHDYMLAGIYLAGGATLGYIVSLLNTIINKL